MFALLGRLPVCSSCRVLRGSSLARRTSVRAMTSSTRVFHALKNRRTGVTVAPPAPRGEAHTDAPRPPTLVASETVSVGQRLYSLTQYYMQSRLNPGVGNLERERMSTEAWNLLQSISEEELEALPLRDVVEIVVAYNYFSCTWANGLNGPASAVKDGKSSGGPFTFSSQLSVDEQPLDYPIIERNDLAAGKDEAMLHTAMAAPLLAERDVPLKRASPLDEILEF
ncbi:hypothetical protein JIQ42_03492 [Leishmania sp. Namibia]|uniref:hypothetical protein n=1 Tax=Leishmania sp. Namibia TaxID=2802991 RepID=UPI001B69546F|nr:hypothetical protein JIQ42_03492 [Leishmania sp. Namibia]